jgi:hypothetical protein
MGEAPKDKRKRLEQAWQVIRDYNREILNNETVIKGRKYSFVTATDVINRLDKTLCAYCYLHDYHTPCGPQLQKWKDCKLKDMDPGQNGVRVTGDEVDEDNECNKIFKVRCF